MRLAKGYGHFVNGFVSQMQIPTFTAPSILPPLTDISLWTTLVKSIGRYYIFARIFIPTWLHHYLSQITQFISVNRTLYILLRLYQHALWRVLHNLLLPKPSNCTCHTWFDNHPSIFFFFLFQRKHNTNIWGTYMSYSDGYVKAVVVRPTVGN